MVLVNLEGVTACLDPVLLDWLEYNPIQKVVPAKEKKIELDLEIAKAASPLQGNISQGEYLFHFRGTHAFIGVH